ncbi:MAG TPA: RNA polymerase sigma factor [Solirubrobacteraceae bacterium]
MAPDRRLVALVRRGEQTAFESIYDRHASELLSFCRYMLGSLHDAEDAVQNTFASAYRALRTDDRAIALRPWLFAIARNECLTLLRQRRPCAELKDCAAPRADPSDRAQLREDVRQVLASLLELPERQRAALVLSEIHGFGHRDIADLMGVRTEQVKAYVFQARTSLVSERSARGADCGSIRAELATARGAALLRSHLRRHVRTCSGCRDYASDLSSQRRALAILMPVVPSLALRRRSLETALGRDPSASLYAGGAAGGVSVAATSVELAGGGAKALLAKVLAGAALVGAGSGAGVAVVVTVGAHPSPASGRGASQLAAAVGRRHAVLGDAGTEAGGGGASQMNPASAQATPAGPRLAVRSGARAGGNAAGGNARSPGSAAKGGESGAAGRGGGEGNPGKGHGAEGNPGKGRGEGNPGGGHGKSAEGNPGKGHGAGNPGKGPEGKPGKGKGGGAEGNPGKGPEGNPGIGKGPETAGAANPGNGKAPEGAGAANPGNGTGPETNPGNGKGGGGGGPGNGVSEGPSPAAGAGPSGRGSPPGKSGAAGEAGGHGAPAGAPPAKP